MCIFKIGEINHQYHELLEQTCWSEMECCQRKQRMTLAFSVAAAEFQTA